MNNYMNGMGMNGLNPMQNYNMYYNNKSSFPNSQESTVKGNTIWVQGYEGASAFRMEPNSLFVLLEDNLEKMYIKSTDNIGMCNGLRRFKLIEEKDEIKKSDKSTDLSDYVRKDELQSLLLSMIHISRYNKFLPEPKVTPAGVIPSSWNGYTRQEVDSKTKQSAVKAGLEKWMNWEKSTKKFFEKMYKELMNIDEVAAAFEFQKLICDVDCELKKVEQYHLHKQAIGYDISSIIAEQKEKHKHYKKKLVIMEE